MTPQHHLPADIERTSMSIITEELAQRRLEVPPENAAVVKRVIHTTADFDYAQNLHFTPAAVAAGIAAMHEGVTIITDTNMALAGITKPGLAKLGGQAVCFMADPAVAAAAKEAGTTRAVAAMHKAAQEYPRAVLAVGNAPTALLAIAEEIENGLRPALVIGVPVGFVNVVESKERLFATCGQYGVPAIVAMGRSGGHLQCAALSGCRNVGPQGPRLAVKNNRGGDTVMYVDWDYYKIFYYVAKYQNFTKAARVLGSNQPNITHTMNKLEDQLHCVLFIRSNRGVTLTPEGENLYARISSAAVQIQDAEEELSASASLSHGAISISATETALNIYLSEQLRGFHAQYPGIRLRITNHSTLQAVQAVKNGEVDFAVVTTPAETGSDLKRVALMPFNEILVGGPSFAELAGRTLALQELIAYPLIMLENGSMSRIFYRQFFLDHNVELKPDIEAGTTDQMLTLVRSDLGLAFVPEPMARGNLHRKRILQMNLQEAIPSRSVCLVYDPRRPLNTAAREFRHQLLESAKNKQK